MPPSEITAAAAGTWTLGDLTVNRIGFGTKRLAGSHAFDLDGLDSVADHFGVLAELRTAGLIRHLGISNVRAPLLAQAQEIAPVVSVQNRYGVDFGRINDDLVRSCGEQGIAFVPFFALAATGREDGGVVANDTVLAVARDRGATPAQVRIAWTLHRGPHVLAIPGTGDADHLAENVAAGALTLSADELARLEESPSAE